MSQDLLKTGLLMAGKVTLVAGLQKLAKDPACLEVVGKTMFCVEHGSKQWTPQVAPAWRELAAAALNGLINYVGGSHGG